jgi:hypothetical protein
MLFQSNFIFQFLTPQRGGFPRSGRMNALASPKSRVRALLLQVESCNTIITDEAAGLIAIGVFGLADVA